MSLNYKYINRINKAVPPPKTFLKRSRFLLRKKVLDYLSSININNEKSFMRCICCHYVFDDQTNKCIKVVIVASLLIMFSIL